MLNGTFSVIFKHCVREGQNVLQDFHLTVKLKIRNLFLSTDPTKKEEGEKAASPP